MRGRGAAALGALVCVMGAGAVVPVAADGPARPPGETRLEATKIADSSTGERLVERVETAPTAVQPGVAPGLKAGFPAPLHNESGTWVAGASGVLVGDIDGDPELEILASGQARGPVVAFEPDGTPVDGWPNGLSSFHEYITLAEVSSSRPGLEVFGTEFGDRSWVADGRGRPLPGWPRVDGNFGSSAGVAADLDGDGRDEIVVQRESYGYFAFMPDGRQLPGWPRGTGNGKQRLSQPAIGDIDGDGDPEIVGGDWVEYDDPTPNLFAWHADGTRVTGWPVHVTGFDDLDRPVIGQVDSDTGNEVVVVTDGILYVLSGDGSVKRSWPVLGADGRPAMAEPPALADLDDDGDAEIVVNTPDLLHVYQDDESELPGFPVATAAPGMGGFAENGPVLGDLDGDGEQDVVVTGTANDASGSYFRVWAFDRHGSPLAGFPLSPPLTSGYVSAVADLDRNGRTDLVVAGANNLNIEGPLPGIFVYEYPTGSAAPPAWSQYGGGPRHQGVERQALAPAEKPALSPHDTGPLVLLRDAAPGVADANPAMLTPLGDRMVYSATTPEAGRELWVSDATPNGTTLLRDIRPGPGGSRPGGGVAFGGATYFAADDGSSGRELWRSDGTTEGTVRVADLAPGAADSDPRELTVAGSKLYFVADGGSGREVWVSDGTAAGTHIVVDHTVYPSENDGPWATSQARWLAAAGDRLVYLARETSDDAPYGQVWLFGTDGTPAGTQKLLAVELPNWSWVHAVGGATGGSPYAWVRADHRVVRTDGTTAGTSVDPWYEYSDSVLSGLVPRADTALVAARDESLGYELFTTTPGSASPTHTLVRDLAGGTGSGAPSDLTRFRSGWVFTANDGSHGREMWWSDGTVDGSRRLTDIAPGDDSSEARPLVVRGTDLLFSAGTRASGDELWVTDGTRTDTWKVAELATGARGSRATEAVLLGDHVLVAADDGVSGHELWSMPAGLLENPPPTTQITDAPPALTNRSQATFQFVSDDVEATFRCRLDGGSWRSCSSPWTLTAAHGRHTLEVAARDMQAETDPTSAQHSWFVDRVAPSTTITSAPPSRTTSRRARFRFASDDASARFECRRDDGPWRRCTSPKLYDDLRVGTHTFKVRAQDHAGNRDATPAERTWTIERG